MNYRALAEWLMSGETGASSITMACIATGQKLPRFAGAPGDVWDWERCHKLVQAVPEIRQHFGTIGKSFPGFRRLFDKWDELVSLYNETPELSWSCELNQRIKKLLAPPHHTPEAGE